MVTYLRELMHSFKCMQETAAAVEASDLGSGFIVERKCPRFLCPFCRLRLTECWRSKLFEDRCTVCELQEIDALEAERARRLSEKFQ